MVNERACGQHGKTKSAFVWDGLRRYPFPACWRHEVFTIATLSLRFDANVPACVQSRISYALRVFAAIYAHTVTSSESDAAIQFFYGQPPSGPKDSRSFHIPSLYQSRLQDPGRTVFTKHRFSGEDFYLSCGMDATTGRPDWLGEIFLWLSSGYEEEIRVRDRVGRIPFSETVFSRQGLSPRKPHASLLMSWMEHAIRHGPGTETLPKAPCPVTGCEHLVLCSHDIDFYFVNWLSTAIRLVKNCGIAILVYHSASFFKDNVKMCSRLMAGGRVGNYLAPMVEAAGHGNFRSTFFVVPRRNHRRDPNYRLEQISPDLCDAASQGISVGIHGSYRSIIEDRSLAAETADLSKAMGSKPLGGRQHWLRFSRHQDLFAQVRAAGLLADSTLGFPDMVGFRNGASFPFPPYDFAREQAHDFLEIPLVVMDGSLEAASRQLHIAPQRLADEVLSASRKLGWGGISILWHNPLEALSVPAEINRVFWRLANQQQEVGEKWVDLKEFLSATVPCFQRCGLMTGARSEG